MNKNSVSVSAAVKKFLLRYRGRLVVLLTALVLSFVLFLVSADHFFGVNVRSLRKLLNLGSISWVADDYPLSVHFIDVGNGDCILICCEGKYAMIDTGSRSVNGTAKNYLRDLGVNELELFVVSHSDSDHVGDLGSIADSFKICNVFLSSFDDVYDNELPERNSLLQQLSEHSINVIDPGTSQFTLGSAKLSVLSPMKKYSDANNNSLVIRLEYGDVSFLFTGDIGTKAEKDLLSSGKDLKADVLKVAHHGSRYSTSQEFCDAVSPKYAVVSASVYDENHPHRETAERIRASGAELLSTDNEGTIILATEGRQVVRCA